MKNGENMFYHQKNSLFWRVFLFCAPGMGVNLVVKVHCRRGSTSLLAKGKGAHREVGSGGSRRQ
ncbi:hypothetical protein, partial [Moorella sp. E308F]|uniref:hypothetical protein n=1 Tax=Moorella sp. E308F TaxID=2572682 RepID=UPI001C0F1BC9